MHLRLVHTLSLLLLGVILAAVVAFGGMLAWNLRNGFNDYMVARDTERLEQFATLIAEHLQRSGGLEAFTSGGIDLRRLLAEFGQRQGFPVRPPMPATPRSSPPGMPGGFEGPLEGFFGSATQIEWLRRGEAALLPQGVAALHIHAINPYGFAWLRRTNESNVDINRNWMDFGKPLPPNPLYDELADVLCPSDWSPESQAQTGARMAAWIERHGPRIYQQAVSGGQWTHPGGLFYGGTEPCWSRRVLEGLIGSHLGKAARICVLDFHTGLGPYGYAEPIIGRRREDPGFLRTRAWIGAAAKSLYGDGSSSAEVTGDTMSALPHLMPHALVDVVALECGIRPINEVALALRADAWLHGHGDPLSAEAKPIKAMVRAAFHSDEPIWQGMALGQGLAACRAALGGVS